MTAETPEPRVERVLVPLLRDAVKEIELIGNLSAKDYDWPGREVRVQEIFAAIGEAAVATQGRFGLSGGTWVGLGEDRRPDPATALPAPIATHDGDLVSRLTGLVQTHGEENV